MRWGRTILGAGVVMMLLVSGAASADSSSGTAGVSEAGEADSLLRIDPGLLRATGTKKVLRRDVRLVVGKGATTAAKFTSKLPVGDRGAKVPVQTVDVDGGRVDAFLPKAEVPRGVLLQAPDKILGISTEGHMAVVVEEERILIAAIDGDVLVGQDSKFKPLEANKVRIFSRATGLSQDVVLPSKVSLSSNTGLSVALTGSVSLELKSSTKKALRLVITDALGSPISAVRRVDAGAPLRVTVPRAGIYYALARELGEGEIAGPLSAPLKIQVLGLAAGQAPPENGVFLLSGSERVRLAGTDGLEVRYGSSPDYVPASNSIGLGQRKETLVEFRNPKDPKQKAILKLAPRYMKKVIELGPSGARWPGNPVKLRVGLWDGAGKLLHHGKDMKVQVTVNSAKVPVSWRTTDDGLISSIPKQKGDGPWVVRVNILDKRGETIARDFLEVAAR